MDSHHSHRSDQKPGRQGGLGLRTKLVLGFVGLLAILIAVGVESITLLDDLGGSIDVILRENYKSVIACGQMKEALERMDSGALFALAGEEAQGRALVEEHRPRFDEALKTELGNVTLPGEGERAQRLSQLFSAFVPVLNQVLDPALPLEARRGLYFQQLYPTFRQIKGTAGEILEMNQRNMVEAKDRARETANGATRRMALLLLAGTAFAGLCVFFLTRAILVPLERLTWAAGEIENGNLDLAVPVTSGDEMGQLATAFNSMAGGLKELRETEQGHLLRVRNVLQSALDQLPEALAIFSLDRRVELANQAAVELGLRPGEPVPERHAGWLSPLLDRIGSGRGVSPGASEAPFRVSAEGGERMFLPHGKTFLDGQGHPDALVLILEDVTGRHRGREVRAGLLANAARDLERALVPLRSALESLEAERIGPLTPRQKQRLEEVRAETGHAAEVAANLLAMAGLEESREQLRPEAVTPGDLLAPALRETARGCQEKGVRLVTDADPEAPRVLADRERAGLVLTSLLRNACAHTPAGGSVTVKADPWEGRVRFTVSDTGEGIPSAHLERIFEPFYQVPGTQDQGGVGLGLPISRDIVRSHGGEIHVDSEEGRGTTVWFTLPAAVD